MKKEDLRKRLLIAFGELTDALSNEDGCFDEIATKALSTALSCDALLDRTSNNKLIQFDKSVFDDMSKELVDAVFIANDGSIMFSTSFGDDIFSRELEEVDRHTILMVVNEITRMSNDDNYDVCYCPFCGGENIEYMGIEYEPRPFHCHECDRWFGLADDCLVD